MSLDPQPPPQPDPGPPRRRSPSWLRFVLLGCALIVASSAALCTHRVLNTEIPRIPRARETREVVRPTASVVTAVRDLARLETATARVERVVDLRDRQSNLFGLVEAEDAILLVASGDVVAGVDLAQLDDDAVSVGLDGAVHVRLPGATVFSARLDNDATYVHTRDTDTLARRSESLETRARQEAERTMRAAALEGGLIDRANQNAVRTVEALLRSLGHDRVSVTTE